MKSALEMLKGFAKEVHKYAAAGAPHVSKLDYKERISACKACPHLKEKLDRCGLCGCLIEHKAKWATATCPDDPKRWKAQKVGKEGTKIALKAKENDNKKSNSEASDEV